MNRNTLCITPWVHSYVSSPRGMKMRPFGAHCETPGEQGSALLWQNWWSHHYQDKDSSLLLHEAKQGHKTGSFNPCAAGSSEMTISFLPPRVLIKRHFAKEKSTTTDCLAPPSTSIQHSLQPVSLVCVSLTQITILAFSALRLLTSRSA